VSPRLASGPVSWGVDFAGAPGNPDWRVVLDGIAAAGYAGTELGPYGYLPPARGPLERRRLALTGGFLFEPLHDPRHRHRITGVARDVASRVRELGGGYLLIIDAVSGERAATAGRPADARRLDQSRHEAMVETIAAVAETAVAAGLRPLVHPHAGTYIEFADEVAALRGISGFCLDTGHCAYAGIDPVAFYDEAPGSVGCVHLKDLDLDRVVPGFWDSVHAGAFVALGRGGVDFAALLGSMARHGYDGWAVVEQDRAAGSGDAVADLVASRAYLDALREAGVA